jgi:hypothetical protein
MVPFHVVLEVWCVFVFPWILPGPVMSKDNEKKYQQHDLSGQSWCDRTRNVLLGHLLPWEISLCDTGQGSGQETGDGVKIQTVCSGKMIFFCVILYGHVDNIHN